MYNIFVKTIATIYSPNNWFIDGVGDMIDQIGKLLFG